jgi:type III secretion protein C
MIKNDVSFMKKVFSDRLFLKLGLLISIGVISQSNVTIYASQEHPSPPPLFFSIDSPNQNLQSWEQTYDKAVSTAYQVVSEAKTSHSPVFFSLQETSFDNSQPINTSEDSSTEIISSTHYPSTPEPYYPVSVPNAKSPQPEKPLSTFQSKQEYNQASRSSVLPQQETSVKKQLLSISEAASKGTAPTENSNDPAPYGQEPNEPEKNRYNLPEDENAVISPPHFSKPSKAQIREEDRDPPRPEPKQVSDIETKAFSPPRNLNVSQRVAQNEAPLSPNTTEQPTAPSATASLGKKTILINFNNVSIIEFIRFISRVSNKNFVFDETDLQFNVTIVSEEPTSIDNIMTALLQELRIHDLTLIEQGNNLIIHKNPKVNSVSKVVADDIPDSNPSSAEIVTQVFRLNTLEPDRAIAVIRPLVSDNAILEFIRDTNHLIVTDLHANVLEIAKLLKSLDAPNSGLVIGQYVAKTADINQLVPLAQQIMSPISKDNPLVFVPYENSNSIFIVSSPFLVERSISILQHLDQDKGKTRILNLQELQYEGLGPNGSNDTRNRDHRNKENFQKPSYHDEVRPSDAWDYGPSTTFVRQQDIPSRGEESNILPLFIPVEIPTLSSSQEKELENAKRTLEELEALRLQHCNQRPPPPWHVGVTEFTAEETVRSETVRRNLPINTDYIPVPVNRAKFYIHKLQYRRGDVIAAQIQQIGTSMQNTRGNDELLETINTIQWLQDSKSLVFTGAPEYLNKVRELVEQIDIPLRQVYIEMLILDTSVDDSLNYAVNWANRFGGGNQAGSQGFTTGPSTLQGTMDSTGVTDLGTGVPNIPPGTNRSFLTPFNQKLVPDPTTLAKNTGFSLGVIGQNIIHKGLGIEFNSIGALVTALHTRTTADIVLNPKIITEDNVPAQIFVGITTPFKTQSVSNDQGSIITNNFEFRDVGTSLQVTPHLHNSDLITLDIFEERSSLATTPASSGNSNEVIGPTTNKNSTKTTVHVPSGFFVIISGMIEDDTNRTRQQVPCLGSAPLIGGAFSDKANSDAKRNLMIFIRPQIVDTDEEFQNLTRHQQDVWQFKYQSPKFWVQETEEALDFFNVKSTINTDDEDLPPCHQFAH